MQQNYPHHRNSGRQDSSVSVGTKLRIATLRNRGEAIFLPLLRNDSTSSAAHPASCSLATGRPFFGNETTVTKLTTGLHMVLRLNILGSMPTIHPSPLLRGYLIKNSDKITFALHTKLLSDIISKTHIVAIMYPKATTQKTLPYTEWC
jgi:hypothetical protein